MPKQNRTTRVPHQAQAAAETPFKWWHVLVLGAVVAVLFVFYLVVELRHNSTLGFPLDDPWIHLTFARNLAHGWGFAYNHGEPVAGSSAPLWTLILAFFHLFTASAGVMVLVAKLLGMVFLAATSVCAYLIAVRLTRNQWAGLGSGLAVATLGPMGWAMMSGMEVTLSAALTLAGIYYYLRQSRGWKAYVPWVLFGLAAWTRPECLSLPLFAALDVLLQRVIHRRRPMLWRGLLAWLVVTLPYFVLNLALSGSPFPQTFAAKAGTTSLFTALAAGNLAQVKGLSTSAWLSYFADFAAFLWRTNPVLTLLVPVGLVGLVVNAVRREKNEGFLVPLVTVGYVPLMGMVAPAFGPSFQSGRYIGNVTALAAIVSVLGIVFVARRVRSSSVRTAVVGLILLLVSFNAVSVTVASARNTAQAASSINRMQVALGRWLAANTPASATLACQDIGAIGYFSGRKVIDLAGLVTKDVLKWRDVPRGRQKFILDVKPDYLVVFPEVFTELLKLPYFKPVAYADVKDNTVSLYDVEPRLRTVAGILVLDQRMEFAPVTMVVYRCDWGTAPAR
jgi:hypothetical protein